jgi:hypothetical protein
MTSVNVTKTRSETDYKRRTGTGGPKTTAAQDAALVRALYPLFCTAPYFDAYNVGSRAKADDRLCIALEPVAPQWSQTPGSRGHIELEPDCQWAVTRWLMRLSGLEHVGDGWFRFRPKKAPQLVEAAVAW